MSLMPTFSVQYHLLYHQVWVMQCLLKEYFTIVSRSFLQPADTSSSGFHVIAQVYARQLPWMPPDGELPEALEWKKKKKALESLNTVSEKWGGGRKRKQVTFIVHRGETFDTVQRKKELGLICRDRNINVTPRTKNTNFPKYQKGYSFLKKWRKQTTPWKNKEYSAPTCTKTYIWHTQSTTQRRPETPAIALSHWS